MILHPLRLVAAVFAGWLAWLWFAEFYSAGEASLAGPVSFATRALIWAILAGSALVMFGIGMFSPSLPWIMCLVGILYPLWRLLNAYDQSPLTAIVIATLYFLMFILAALLGTRSRNLFGLR